jgi:hypothetical protein
MVRLFLGLLLATLVWAETPFWPHYPTRLTQTLDGQWAFGFRSDIADVVNVQPSDAITPSTILVPSAFDVKPPGTLGERGTAFYRLTLNVSSNTPSALYFSACSFYCKVTK